jgi:DNA-binding NarL/FixJ family response regulator
MSEEVRIVLADDHPVVRKGLKLSIEEDVRLKVVAEAGDGEAALMLIKIVGPNPEQELQGSTEIKLLD